MVSSSKGKVCVTGASGFIASWLIKQLLESGYHVVGTVRDPGIYPHIIPFAIILLVTLYIDACTMNFFSSSDFSGNRQKVAHLWKLPGAKERLQIVRADLLEEGSFDEAVMDCEGVFHTASPVLAKSDSSSKACCFCFKQFTLLCIELLFYFGFRSFSSNSSFLPCKCIYLKLNCSLMVFMLQEATLVPAVNGTLNVLRSCKKNPFLKRVVLTSSSSAVRIRDDAQPNISLDETIWSSVPLCEKMQVIN